MLHPHLLTSYEHAATNRSLAERFHADNCWQLRADNALATFEAMFADAHDQFDFMSWNRCRSYAGRNHVTEHFGHSLLHVLFHALNIGQWQWHRSGVFADALGDGCPTELKSRSFEGALARQSGSEGLGEPTLRAVRLLIYHALHWDPQADGEQFFFYAVPHYCIAGSEGGEAVLKRNLSADEMEDQVPLSTHEIDENSISPAACSHFRLSLLEPDFDLRLKTLLWAAYPSKDRMFARADPSSDPSQAWAEPS